MSKSNAVLKSVEWTVSKDEKGKTFTVSPTFKSSAVKAAGDYDKLMLDIRPIAANLNLAYKRVVQGNDGFLTRLEFYRTFDQSIPTIHGTRNKQGVPDADRKKLDSHTVYNRLVYLAERLGKQVNEGVVKRDPKVGAKLAQTKKSNFASFCKEAKLSAKMIRKLVVVVLGMKGKKTNEPTKRGVEWMKAAGLTIVESD